MRCRPRGQRRQRALRADADARITAGIRPRASTGLSNWRGIAGNLGVSHHIGSMLAAVQDVHQTEGIAAAARCGGRGAFARLVPTAFRNYRSARLDLDASPVVLSGPNGAGKTNLLEAMSFLSPGRGLRNARLGDIDRRTASAEQIPAGWAVAATIASRHGAVRIGTGRDGNGGEGRAIRSDGEPVRSQSALAERLGVLWLIPQMDRLFVEGPEARRRFMDRLLLGGGPAATGPGG